MAFKTQIKSAVIAGAEKIGAFDLGQRARRMRHGNKYLRAVNYHATPATSRSNFEAQLDFLQTHFHVATKDDLEGLYDERWEHGKPGLLLSFDDGLVSNYEVAGPVLEARGLCGWFFVPSGLVFDPSRPRGDGGINGLLVPEQDEEVNHVMTWDQVRDMDKKHIIGCHSMTHVRLAEFLGPQKLREEIVDSKKVMERALGHPVDEFCWVGGETWSYSRTGENLVREAGYRYSFMTNVDITRPFDDRLGIQRTNIESDWDLARVRFYLSGIMDLSYGPKRRWVAKATAPAATVPTSSGPA